MSWRVVIISKRCKLEYKLGYLVSRGEEVKKVFISEIGTLIIESTGVSITAALMCELIKNKVNVVFCNEKHNPVSQLLSLYGRYNASGCLKKQINWAIELKEKIWREIVRLKIMRQHRLLESLGSEQAYLLCKYADEVQPGDSTNREGHAAKVYFNALFGLSFKRGDSTFYNSALDYGYAIILSAFNREVVANGYNTQLGLAHKNEFNFFNLSCDLMEPFRVLIDKVVFSMENDLNTELKYTLCNVLNEKVRIGGEMTTVSSAIGIYCKSVFEAIETKNIGRIECYEL